MAELILDGVEMVRAGLDHDWDEARFRCQLILGHAALAGHMELGFSAAVLKELLGEPGTEPGPGHGAAMHQVSQELDMLHRQSVSEPGSGSRL